MYILLIINLAFLTANAYNFVSSPNWASLVVGAVNLLAVLLTLSRIERESDGTR